MHPLLAAAYSKAVVADRTGAPRPRAVRRGAATSGHAAEDAGEVVIRRATAADAQALVRLGALDGDLRAGELLADAAHADGVLVAEADGSLEAALALDGGLAVADPFRPSALHAQLLALRSRQLGGDAARRSGGRLGVLHLRTS
jgi:hypothetical protein